jgi:hypothetical protein
MVAWPLLFFSFLLLTDGLMQWFNDKQIQPAAYPAPFHRLIKQQNEIGWHQLFNGCFSSEWQQLQDQHLRRNGIKEISLTGQSWTASLIVHLWKSFFDIWEQRNKFVHGEDKSTRDTAKRVKVISQIKHLDTKTIEVLAAHQSIMFMIAPDTTNGQDKNALDAYLQTKTTIYLQNWVYTWKPAIEASIRSAKALSVDTMGRIDDHFSYLVPPPKRPPRSRVPPNKTP